MLSKLFDRDITTNKIYDSRTDGFKADTFHPKCDNKGSTLIIIKSKENERIFGGFTDIPWNKEPVGSMFQQKVKDYNTFLFKVDDNNDLIKFPHK